MTCLFGKHFYLLFLLVCPLSAAQPWTLALFTSDPHAVLAAAARYAVPDGLNAITFDYSVDIQIDDSGKMKQTTRSVTRVLRLQGIAGARRISIAWVPWRQNRPTVKVRVITADGKAHLLDQTQVAQSNSAEGRAVLSAVLPYVDVDSVVELEIDESDREAAMPGARFGEVIPNTPFLIGDFRVGINGSGLHAEVRGFREPPRMISQSMGQVQRLAIEASNVPPLYASGLLPPETASRPTVDFSSAANWHAVAQWYAAKFQSASPAPPNAHPPSPENRLAAIEDAFEDLRAKVHESGARFGAAPYAPESPAETLKTGAGASEDEAALLISKLAALGIAAKPALVSAEPDPDVLRNLPGLEAFNHVLVYVPGPQPLWIDPAAEFTPVSYLPLRDQGRSALIIDAATTDLTRIPESTAADNRESHTLDLHLGDGTPATLTETIDASGAFDALLRPLADQLKSDDTGERDKTETLLARAAGMQHVTKTETANAKKLLQPFQIRVTGEGYAGSQLSDEGGFVDLPGPVSTNVRRLAVALRLGTNPESGVPARNFDYYVPPAFTEENTYKIVLPLGFKFKALPQLSSFTVGPLQFSASAQLQSDGSLRISYHFVSPKNRYTPQEVDAVRHDVPKLATNLGVRVLFYNIAEAKLADGDLQEAIALLRKHSAAAPSNTAVQFRLATAYVNAGARQAAVHICNQILAKDPKDAAAYARLGWIYSHDEFGRPYRAGMNSAEAEKAYLKAIDLDAKPGYSVDLATLYTFNSAGIRFGSSARVDDAVRLYAQAGLDALARSGAINDYAAALLFSKQYPRLRQFFLYPQADHADPAIKLAGIAAGSSLDEAKSEVEYDFPDPSKRRTALAEAARFLLLSRAFAPAAGLFALAGGAGISNTDLALIQKARNFDSNAASSQPAVAAFQHFIVAVLNPPDPDSWKKFVVPEQRDASWAHVRWQLLQLFGRQELAGQTVSWPWISDVLATAIDYRADPDPQIGDIRIEATLGTGPVQTLAHVVKRGADYLVLNLASPANSNTQQASYQQALAQANSGDLKDARARAYTLMDQGGNAQELLAIFARIADQLDLKDVAADYSARARKTPAVAKP